MSKGCWLFTLKITVQSLGNRDFTFRCFLPNVNTDKSTSRQYLGLEAKNEKMKKIKVLYFLQLQKFEKIKWSYFSPFWPLGRDIED